MSADPFLIQGPAVISFSGGRTSGYMLHRIIEAHGGTLPDDVLVCFCNTGREMPETLQFVHDCGAVFGVTIHWLEYSSEPGRFIEVSHNSAARAGEPFEALVHRKSMLPNPIARFCTTELKIRPMALFAISLGWEHWTNVVGLRADEPARVARTLDPERTRKSQWNNACPLAEAGIDEVDVLRFWRERYRFHDLRLPGPWAGNCDGCFLKNRASLQRMFVDYPERMSWWARMEAIPHGVGAGGTFRADREDYATMAATMRDQGRLPFDLNEPALSCEDAACGV